MTLAEIGKNLPMRDMFILLVHLISTLARLLGPGGLRSVVAETLLVKQQMLILNRSRERARTSGHRTVSSQASAPY